MTEKNKTAGCDEIQAASNNAISEQYFDPSLSGIEVEIPRTIMEIDVPLALSDWCLGSHIKLIMLRKQLEQQMAEEANLSYQDVTCSGKSTRTILTDAIQVFVGYAKSNGSQNADRYYSLVTNTINHSCFIIETKAKNIRERLTPEQLYTLETAELVAANVLTQGMENKLPYKDIFQEVKKELGIFSVARTRVLGAN
ncbi:hypothetical protein [Methylobacter luteus]|jgi:hypothetical protein|uniref:hypothetical protein n=1 Tax=Methylobacter luteus TaxID=415 RepID=UPI000413C619|nr:hypothetical protein [Methylobacter luteus]